MFGSNDQSKEARKNGPVAGSVSAQSNNSLVVGTKVEGKIFTESDIRIDGRVVGSVSSKGKVVIGSTGQIDGEINCRNAVIEGRFTGNLIVAELLHVKESAVIEGDVSTGKLMVHAGATFNVVCKMGSGRTKEVRKEEAVALELSQLTKVTHQ